MTPFHIQREDAQSDDWRLRSQSDLSTDPQERLNSRNIYGQLIEDELRAGRLTPARRRRIVRYAAGMGITAVEAGRLVDAHRAKLAREQGRPEPRPVIRLAETPPERLAFIWKIGAVIVLAVVVDLMVLGLLRP